VEKTLSEFNKVTEMRLALQAPTTYGRWAMGGERYHSQQVCVRGLAHTDLCSTCSHVSFKFQRNNREIAQQLFKMIKFCLQLGSAPDPTGEITTLPRSHVVG